MRGSSVQQGCIQTAERKGPISTKRNRRSGWPVVRAPKEASHVAAQMGSDLSRYFNNRRHLWIRRNCGGERRHRADSLLHFRRDLRRVAGIGPDGCKTGLIAPLISLTKVEGSVDRRLAIGEEG